MARIRGTRRNDDLSADWLEGSLVRGWLGHDTILDGTGNDRLYGDAGNDTISAFEGGFDRCYGGAGNDYVYARTGEAWGNQGHDIVSTFGGLAVGGSGNDQVGAKAGDIYGDEGPGLVQRHAGADQLGASLDGSTYVRMTGGLGADVFSATGYLDGALGYAEVVDFTPGQDRITATEYRGFYEGEGRAAVLFDKLDANDNGVLEWSDSLSGGAVYTDGKSMFIGLGATVAGPTFTDAEDWLTVHGATQLVGGVDFIV